MTKLLVKISDDDKNFPECPLEHEGYCHLPQTHYQLGNALYMQQCLGFINKRPTWCPLKPLPKREPEHFTSFNGEEVHDVYFQGWNDCLDEIMGEENDKETKESH